MWATNHLETRLLLGSKEQTYKYVPSHPVPPPSQEEEQNHLHKPGMKSDPWNGPKQQINEARGKLTGRVVSYSLTRRMNYLLWQWFPKQGLRSK